MCLEMALTQDNAPIYEALERMRRMRVVPFDVPGHKRGRGNQELTDFLGEACMSPSTTYAIRYLLSVTRRISRHRLLVQTARFSWSGELPLPFRA